MSTVCSPEDMQDPCPGKPRRVEAGDSSIAEYLFLLKLQVASESFVKAFIMYKGRPAPAYVTTLGMSWSLYLPMDLESK